MTSLLMWPIVLPLLAALLTAAIPRHANRIGPAAAAATLAAAAYLLVQVAQAGTLLHVPGGWPAGLGIVLRADALAATLLLMVAFVALFASLYASGYFEGSDAQRFWPLWLLLITALNALLLSADLFNLYVTLELLGLSAVALAAMNRTAEAVRASLRYLMVGLLGSLFFLAGVALIYARYGTMDMIALAELLVPGPAAWLALALMSAGLLLKCALFPLHFWLPQAHANAPAPVSAALSALVVKAAFYLVVRFWLELFEPVVTNAAAWMLGWLGAFAILWGSWNALRAERLKLLAAYSTVAQLGYLFLFLPLLLELPQGAARDTAFGALVLFMLTHAFAKSAWFLAAGVVQHSAGHDRIAELDGTARLLPMTTFAIALSGIALIGLPPSGSFLAKWELLTAALASGRWLPVVTVAAGSLLAAAYVFRVLGHAFGPGEGVGRVMHWTREELPALLLAVGATAVLGLGAAVVWQFVAPGAFVMEGWK